MTTRFLLGLMFSAAGLLAQGLVEGRAGSPVRVLIYEDLACSDCAVFRTMMDKSLLPKYGDRVAFVHRDFPKDKHPWARNAAVAARYFGEKDAKLGIEFRRFALNNLSRITLENFDQRLTEFAKANGANAEEAVAALKDQRLAALVEKDFQDGVARGVSKTPTVFVNGAPFVETFTLEEISKAIDAALAR